MAKNPSQKEAQAALDKQLKATNALSDAERERIGTVRDLAKAMGESYSSTKALLAVREKTRSLEKEMKSLLESEALAQDDSVKMAEKALKLKKQEIEQQAAINDKINSFKKKFKQFYDLATDPKIAKGLFLVAAADKAMEISGTLMDAQHSMGLSYTQGLAMAGTLAKSAGSGMLLGIGFEKSAKAAGALATEMGDLDSVTSTAVVAVAKLSKTYGVSEASGAKLFKQIKLMSNESDKMVKHQMLSVANLAKANNVAPGAVMEDMAQSSEFMAKFGGKSALSMAETAVQAAKLGTNMSAIDQMMTSILDIETSIEKEMQVSVLLGRQINFDRARQLAMAGKTVEATKEILAQVGGIAEFEKMSVIQRKALADAAGVDLATMQSMIGNKEKQIKMGLVEASTSETILGYIMGTGKTIKKNMGLIASTTNMLANMGKLRLKERIAAGIEFAKKAGRWALEKAHWVWKMATSSKFRKDQAKALKEGLNGIKDKAKAMFTGTGGKRDAKGILRNAKGQFMKDPSKIKSMKTPDLKSSAMPKGSKGKVSDMGVSKLGKNMKNIVMGAAAMVLVAGAVFIFGKAVQEFMSVSWSAVGMAVVSMLALVGAVALLGAIMMSGVGALAIIAGAAAMLIVAGAMLVLAIALKIVSEAIPNFLLLIPMLPELSIGLLTLAPAIPIMPLIGYGLILLGAGFGVAAVGVGLFGLVGGVEIITGLAAGMAILTPLASGIGALGLAFGILGLGIMSLGASLVMLTPMLPTLLLLGGLAMGVGAIVGGMSGGGDKDDGSNVIAEKLDILIDLMSKPGVVNMDGKKVGDVIALARGPMGT